MGAHKYKTGQMISLKHGGMRLARATGTCKVLATLPESGGTRQYRVRFEGESFDRCVSEDEIQTSPAQGPEPKPAKNTKEKDTWPKVSNVRTAK